MGTKHKKIIGTHKLQTTVSCLTLWSASRNGNSLLQWVWKTSIKFKEHNISIHHSQNFMQQRKIKLIWKAWQLIWAWVLSVVCHFRCSIVVDLVLATFIGLPDHKLVPFLPSARRFLPLRTKICIVDSKVYMWDLGYHLYLLVYMIVCSPI